uniref:Small ribosomal subunit protein bS16c n=1 Tax=Caloglossa intermedia TaxID=100879 RepID=A0A1Z1M723_9FLOR|nr:ribosomal protein S16 [Caloglossa intermedia]ARW61554.1 ribosomal protein S16 [Caloglossa intermedia]
MLKIRLKRLGKKKKPCYRIITIDSRRKRDGKPIEELGFYNPLTKNYKLDLSRVYKRIENGAKATQTIKKLLNSINK